MRRALALVGAVLLVVVAVLVRGAIAGDDDSDDASDGPAGLVVACIPELRQACGALDADVRIEDPADTIGHADDVDAWVTFDPWPAMAQFDLGHDFPGDSVDVATTGLVLVTRQDLADACTDPIDWACVAEQAPERVAVPALRRALGPIVLGWAALDWSQTTRPGERFTRTELELPEFHDWVDDLDRGQSDPLREALQLGVAGPRAVGTTGVAAKAIDGSREDGKLVPHAGAHPATVAVVVAGPEADRIAGDPAFTHALGDLGWDTRTTTATSGLPDPGVLYALLQEVS